MTRLNNANKALFFAGREHGLTKKEVTEYRKKYGKKFEELGYIVNDPTLGKEIDKIPRGELIAQDYELQDQSHLTVAYIPASSDQSKGVLREIKRAKELKQLVYGFTDQGNELPAKFSPYIDAYFTKFEELENVLAFFLKPIGQYFTSAHTNNISGNVFIYGRDISEVAPHHLFNLLKQYPGKRNLYYFCCETSHINDLAQKLPTILRLGKVENLIILTKDGTPHDVQMHTIAEEVVDNQAYRGHVAHFVVEKGKLVEANQQAVKASRHLSHIMGLLEAPAAVVSPRKEKFVAVLTGAESDEEIINKSGIFKLLDQAALPYEYEIISSDRTPEELRRYCFDNRDKILSVIAIAGGVPNLPIVAKSWLPATPVICVPLDNRQDYALASLTTPKDRPIIVAGFGSQGLKKAVYISKEILHL